MAAISVAALGGACTGDPTTSGTPGTGVAADAPAGAFAPGAPGGSMPPHPTTSSNVAPVVTTPDGAPAVLALEAPETFRCMADGVLAQITVGWSVPSATAVTVLLDGEPPPSGIQDRPPYAVPAGPPTGIGSTIVFACDDATEHTVTVTWAMGERTSERTFTVTRDEAEAGA